MENRPRWSALFFVVLGVALLDQVTKAVVRVTLAPGEQVDLLGVFSVYHARNPGIAGGELQGSALPLALVAIALVAWIHAYLVRTRGFRPWFVIGFGLMLGGGIGNLVDRLRLGWVTDFIRDDDRVYNLADVAIFFGGVIVLTALIASLVLGRGGPRAEPSAAEAEAPASSSGD